MESKAAYRKLSNFMRLVVRLLAAVLICFNVCLHNVSPSLLGEKKPWRMMSFFLSFSFRLEFQRAFHSPFKYRRAKPSSTWKASGSSIIISRAPLQDPNGNSSAILDLEKLLHVSNEKSALATAAAGKKDERLGKLFLIRIQVELIKMCGSTSATGCANILPNFHGPSSLIIVNCSNH